MCGHHVLLVREAPLRICDLRIAYSAPRMLGMLAALHSQWELGKNVDMPYKFALYSQGQFCGHCGTSLDAQGRDPWILDLSKEVMLKIFI